MRGHVVLVPPDSSDFVFQNLFKKLLFVSYVLESAGHHIPNATACRQSLNVRCAHSFPHVFVLQFPARVHDSVVSLHIREEALVVKSAACTPVEAVHAGILRVHFLTCERFPEVDFLLALGVRWLPRHYPSVGALAVGSNNNICI